jgi:hypothetical protein
MLGFGVTLALISFLMFYLLKRQQTGGEALKSPSSVETEGEPGAPP